APSHILMLSATAQSATTDNNTLPLPDALPILLRLRPYKKCDAKVIASWIKDEVSFRKWSADRYEKYPVSDVDINNHYEAAAFSRSEEHTSELQSRFDLVCRLLLEKKNDAGWSR